ncbi:uncharacterized protein LOC136074445 [Hydra vulgaris]|uniref:Uncharacterized protein LOC136074445 n=1 Tax=Hydra vulgaris TaxID=6087 RepID=A0ABM4B202_HYDVU
MQSILRRYDRTNSTHPGSRGGARHVIYNEEIRKRIEELINDNTTTTIIEIKHALNVNVSIKIVWRWVTNLGYTYKITRPIYERRNDSAVKNLRIEYVRWYTLVSSIHRYRNIVFIDESPFNLHMFRSHSWARRAVTPNPIIRPRQRNVSMILAVNGLSIIHCKAVSVSVNTVLFQEYIDEVVRVLGTEEEFTLVMDNVRIHHNVEMRAQNIQIKYLSPYSPFSNPCEEIFFYLNNNVQRNTAPAARNELITRMREACLSIPNVNLSNYLLHTHLRSDDIPRQ